MPNVTKGTPDSFVRAGSALTGRECAVSGDLPVSSEKSGRLSGILRKMGESIFRASMPAIFRLGGAFLQFVSSIVIARILGADRGGGFFYWSAILMTCGQVATLGLDRLALQQIPRLDRESAERSRFLATIRTISIGFALAFAAGLAAYAFFVQTEPGRPGWWYLLPPACLSGVALCMINGEVMTGLGRPVLGIVYRHTLTTVIFLSAILILGTNLSPDLALVAFSGGFLLAGFGALLGPGLRKTVPRFGFPSGAEFTSHLRQGVPICLSSLFTALAYIVPLTVLERSHSNEQISFLTTAFRLYLLFEILSTAVHSLSMPELSRAAHTGESNRLRKVYRGTTLRGIALLLPPMLVVFLLSGPVMSIFGPEFAEGGAPVLRVLLLFGMASLVFGPASHLLLMAGGTRHLAFYALSRMIGVIALSLLVIPVFGPAGMAVVIGLGLVVEKILCLRRALFVSRPAIPS